MRRLKLLMLALFVSSFFILTGCGGPSNGPAGIASAPVIATTSTIAYGAVNPTVTVTGTNFKSGIAASNLTITLVGTTGLTLNTVSYVSSSQITVSFTGTATDGNVRIQAAASAFNPTASSASNTLTVYIRYEPSTPWTASYSSDSWLTSSPYPDKHDGGWVYSPREDVIYAIYGNDSSGQTLYRIDHIGHSYTVATTFTYGRHGSQPVVDDSGTYIYMPPSCSTSELERYDTTALNLETLATAPYSGCFSHGAWNNEKLWIVLDDYNLYSYDPATDEWSDALYSFGTYANVATAGSNLIYIMVNGGYFYSYDVTDGTVTTLASNPNGFGLGGNGELTWLGAGYIFAMGDYNNPAVYDIASDTWYSPSWPGNSDYAGHATYDIYRHRLYFAGGDNVYYVAF